MYEIFPFITNNQQSTSSPTKSQMLEKSNIIYLYSDYDFIQYLATHEFPSGSSIKIRISQKESAVMDNKSEEEDK